MDECEASVKIALLGAPGAGRTSCLLAFAGYAPGEESQPTAAVAELSPLRRFAAETATRALRPCGMRGPCVTVRIVAPPAGATDAGAASAAIALRGCDAALSVWSTEAGLPSLRAAAALLRTAARHMRPGAPALLLCNLWRRLSSSPPSADAAELLALAETAAAAAGARHVVVCAAAPRGALLGPASFDAVLRYVLCLLDARRAPAQLALSSHALVSCSTTAASSRCFALPSLLQLAADALRRHCWDGYDSCNIVASLPSELHELVLWPPPQLSRF